MFRLLQSIMKQRDRPTGDGLRPAGIPRHRSSHVVTGFTPRHGKSHGIHADPPLQLPRSNLMTPRVRVDQRPDERIGGQRAADLEARECAFRPRADRLIPGGVQAQAPQRRVALPGGAGGTERDRADRAVLLRQRRDDRRVVAAEFEQRASAFLASNKNA
jgi:hypothetical protein